MIDNPIYLFMVSLPHQEACKYGIPSQAMTRNSSSLEISCVITSGKAVTICCSGERSALFLNSKSPIARDKARFPLTRPKSTKPPAALMRAFSPVCQSVWTHHCTRVSHTFVLRFVVKGERLCSTFNAKDGARVSSICLRLSVKQ